MYHKSLKNKEKILSVAPMMDWSDRHCRYFHRVLTRQAIVYTEMMVADAILFGDREYLLRFDRDEQPVALQLGGSDPAKLGEAAGVGAQYGYSEINLNVGCPSDRVQSGTFGACLMREPRLVGECVAAMKQATDVPVTVKCRIGVDDQDTGTALDELAFSAWENGCNALWVHARKAWLEGLSPKQNRDIPPLDYDRVYRLKASNPSRFIGINGGIVSIGEINQHMQHCDGVMIGRAAYQTPDMLRFIDRDVFESNCVPVDHTIILEKMIAYSQKHVAEGGRLNHVTRHMTGLFQGMPGAKRYRQILSIQSVLPDANPRDVLEKAFDAVLEQTMERIVA